jgi:catechol 2,3-dioxygenase-like lactoylglutathione lyase family enzyme
MFSHVVVGSNDIERSRAFYDAVFAALGLPAAMRDEKGRLVYLHKGAAFMVSKPIDGEPATHANGGTVGFTVSGPEAADAWQKAGVAHGGRAIEDAPGVRESAFGKMYLAYLRDPDGNKLCAMHMVG